LARTERSEGSLATRIVRVTLVIGVITVIAAAATSLIGVLRLNQDRAQVREQMLLQIVEDRISGRFTQASEVPQRIAVALVASTGPEAIARASGIAEQAVPQVCERIVIAEPTGRVVASYPETTAVFNVSRWSALEAASDSPGRFVEDTSTAGDRSGIWVSTTVLRDDGSRLAVLVKVNLAFLDQVVGGDVPANTSLAVLASGNRRLAEWGPKLALDGVRWGEQEAGAVGRVLLSDDKGNPMTGYYHELEALGDLGWRIVTVEPAAMLAGDTVRAVAPSLMVLLIGGAIALVAAWGISTRLVAPLRTLEAAAYHAATGAYVRPLRTDRDDEVGRLAEAFNAVTLRLNALHDLSQLMASASRLDQVLDGIMSAMGHIVGPGAVAVYLLDAEGSMLLPARVRGVDDRGTVQPVRATGGGWLARALAGTEPVEHSGERGELAQELPGIAAASTGCVLATPLVAGHEVLGIVVVTQPDRRSFSDAEMEMVRTFSAQAAVAVNNSRLFAVETESRRVAEGLREMVEALVAPTGLRSALTLVESRVKDLIEAQAVVFGVVDRGALGLAPASDVALERDIVALTMQEFGHGEPSQPESIARGTDPLVDRVLDVMGGDVLLLAPIAVASGHGAVLAATGAEFGARQVSVAVTVAKEIGLALDNAYFYERAVSRAANLETIFRISQAVGSSLEINVVLNRVLDVVQKILSGDAVSLMRYDRQRRMIVTDKARGAVSEEMLHFETRPGEDIPGGVFVQGEPVMMHDLRESSAGLGGIAARQSLRSVIAVPLLARGRSIGVLSVFAHEPSAFTEEDMSVLQTFASQAALAIDTARLYSREHLVSTTLVQSILPEVLPQIPGIESASRYVPAGGEAEIGGDFFDVFTAPDGAPIVAIGDVCGKGVLAATKTSMIRYSVRAFVVAGHTPAMVVREVNRMTTEAGDRSDISTLFVGRFDLPKGEIVWASGGHPPGMVRHAESGHIDRLEPTGPLLGALVDVDYDQGSAAFAPGDVLLVYTDGVTEARRGNKFFGEERVTRALIAGGTAREVVDRVLDDVRRYAEGDLRDDVAIVAVRLDPTTDEEQGDDES